MFRAVSTLSLFRVLVAALFLISLCEGQVTVGKISGTVTDQSGALMPGVIVTAIAQGTGVSTQAVTSENGGYVFPSLFARGELRAVTRHCDGDNFRHRHGSAGEDRLRGSF